MRILAISGSLRKNSYNTAALRAAAELSPTGTTFTTADLADIPPYNDDVKQAGFPASVKRIEAQIREADALLFGVAEYNYSVSGVLKNAIDWISRLPDQPFSNKPVAILGASIGVFGTARAQYHFRQVATGLNMALINRPEVMIGQAAQKFDADGRLTDEKTRESVGKLVVALLQWAAQIKK